MGDDEVMALLREAAGAVAEALRPLIDWGPSGQRAGQYRSDVVADAAARSVLDAAGVAVLSEESGTHATGHDLTVVLDPLDGSTNAALGLPWFATSLCAFDRHGPRAALVRHVTTGRTYEAVRGAGATVDGAPIRPSGTEDLAGAVVGISGLPPRPLGWWQFRAYGAIALDLCAVAEGRLDGFVDCSPDAHGPWDYLGALLVCEEAGAPVVDAWGRALTVLGHGDRRTPVAGATPALLQALVRARRTFGDAPPVS